VRKICSKCKKPYQPQEWEKAYLGSPTIKELYRGTGCKLCNGSGYFGRTLVYELLSIDDALARMIAQDAQISQIADRAKEKGFMDIYSVATEKVKQGITTTEEAVRVLGRTKREDFKSEKPLPALKTVQAV
jgi:type II secretory ATPase GspE/PulE/Tfp pilus assembly ATPase PilB-like protein